MLDDVNHGKDESHGAEEEPKDEFLVEVIAEVLFWFVKKTSPVLVTIAKSDTVSKQFWNDPMS